MMLKSYWLKIAVGLLVVTAAAAVPGLAAGPNTQPATRPTTPVAVVPAKTATGPNAALINDVTAIFKASCAQCHDEATFVAAQKKQFPSKNKFGYVLDLSALRAAPKYVTPGNPDKSLLYEQIAKDEMPPPDEDLPPLSAEQKQTVRKWIEADCPVPTATVSAATAPVRTPRPFMTRLIEFLGKFHPLAAHTPIALMMAAAIAEILYLRHPAPALTGAARFCVVLGAMGAVLTAALGWALANKFTEPNDGLELHRWTGTIAGAAAIPLAILGEWAARRAHHEGRKWHGFSRWAFRISVFMVAGFVGFTAHLGGILVWGIKALDFPQY